MNHLSQGAKSVFSRLSEAFGNTQPDVITRPIKIRRWIDGDFTTEVVGQGMLFTSFYDKTGKEIYEGDILETIDFKSPPNRILGTVVLVDGAWVVSTKKGSESLYRHIPSDWSTVVGNIIQNPELL
jgi:uncharacterized phage protein (TIGR01671 family)